MGRRVPGKPISIENPFAPRKQFVLTLLSLFQVFISRLHHLNLRGANRRTALACTS